MERFGWCAFFEEQVIESSFVPVRVVAEHRGRYQHVGRSGPGTSELTGRLARAAPLDRPAVGDWVLLDEAGRIQQVLDRRTRLVRRAAGRTSAPQLVAANVDRVLVVTAPGGDFSARRVERYVAAIRDGGAAPFVALNKVDLAPDPAALLAALAAAAPGVPVLPVSALTGEGMAALAALIPPGLTAALVGSSGVGKSTLLNALLGGAQQRTAPVRASDGRGRHTTTGRSLLLVPDGGLVIDTPGMRLFGLWTGDRDGGLSAVFGEVEALAAGCRFADCSHASEPGCAVRRAIEEGDLDPARLEALRKLEREAAREARRVDAAARHEYGREMKRRHRQHRQRARIPKGYRP